MLRRNSLLTTTQSGSGSFFFKLMNNVLHESTFEICVVWKQLKGPTRPVTDERL